MISWVLFGLVSLLLIVSLYYNYKFARVIIRMEDALEDSLDIMDDRYASISKILDIPLFYDSPQIRQVVRDIKDCQDSILYVASQIGTVEENTYGQDEKEEKNSEKTGVS